MCFTLTDTSKFSFAPLVFCLSHCFFVENDTFHQLVPFPPFIEIDLPFGSTVMRLRICALIPHLPPRTTDLVPPLIIFVVLLCELVLEYYCWYTTNALSISVSNARSIGRGLVAAVWLFAILIYLWHFLVRYLIHTIQSHLLGGKPRAH